LEYGNEPEPKNLSSITIGWIALALCVLTKKTVDQAMDTIAPDPDADQDAIRQLENEDIISLKKNYGLSWEQIGDIFGLSDTAAFYRAKRFKEKLNKTAV
jgi:hypothetical protein